MIAHICRPMWNPNDWT